MKKAKLDKYEKETERALEEALKKGTLKDAPKAMRDSLVRAAKAGVETRKEAKEARINIRIAPEVLERIREAAAKEGIPYQTFIAGALHKLVTGQYVARQQWDELLDRVSKRTAVRK